MTATDDAQRRRADEALPSWLVAHPLLAGWLWLAAFGVLAIAAAALDWSAPVVLAVVALLVLPPVAAMIVVLQATPRRALETHGSVLGHFLTRYLVIIAGFLAWTASIVLGATISTTLSLLAEGRENEVLGTGFSLVLGIVLPAITVLWIVFLLRCAWFLMKVRGWRQFPASTTVPARLLLRQPRLRAVTIGLAHPGVLITAALASGVFLLAIEIDELTLLLA
ncbi:hypothetical protein [Microterricola viridarii]|uniref:Uncharacterized protein n=1 Tax=Microterricola viridarii TaxID=412690 RepID=A0A120I0G7_9MICO|nr:hypothetical protein [Microterricola viridarii]AMB58700.1 hypothetical protein AWU67_07305 [Microterricola viridarii]